MKRKLLLLTAFAVCALTGMRAQTDVTSTYITNADFESNTFLEKYKNSSGLNTRYVYEPEGWSCEYSNGCEWDASVLNKSQPVYSNMSITLPDEQLGSQAYLVRLHGNSKTSQITLSQTKTFPKGKYTLKGLFRTQNQNELEVGFYFDSYSNDNRIKYELGNGSWKEFSTSFVFEESVEKTFGVFFKHTSGNAMVAGVDNITLTYENINKEELSKLIVKAKSINAKLNTLASEISSAESVYENIDDTEAYQTTIDNAITSLNNAVSNALSNYEFDPAGDDISWMITNNGFEQSTASQDDATTSAQALDYSSTGWTRISNGANSCAAVLAYGSGKTLNGVVIPEKDNNDQGGNAMGISIGWNVTISYQSELLKLPEGFYSLKVSAFNAGTSETFKSVFGFVPKEGEAVLSSKTSFEKDMWTTDEISFTLDEETEGYIQLGGQAGTNTSTNHGKIFFDNITLTYYDPLKKAQIDWNAAKEAAEEILADGIYCNVLGSEKKAVENSISSSTPPETINDCNEAINTINTAVEAFKAAKPSYDAYVAEKANAARISSTITVDEPTTAEDAETAVKTLLVGEYTYVNENFNADAAVEYGMTIDKWTPSATSGGNLDTPQTNINQKWGDTATTYYEQGKNGWGSNAWTLNYSKSVTLPAGTYVLKVAARASNGTTAMLKATIGEEVITETLPNASASGKGITTSGVASFGDGEFANSGNGYGWQWRYLAVTLDEEKEVKFEIDASANTTHQWCSFGDVSFISNVSLDELETAYSNFEMKTLGFDEGEYAPYANADILQAYEAAKAIVENAETPSSQSAVNAIIDNMNKEWTVNEREVNAFFDGSFASQAPKNDGNSGTKVKGWTNNVSIRTLVKSENEAEAIYKATDGHAGMFVWNGAAATYGETAGYTMPLNAHTIYKFGYKRGSWNGDNSSSSAEFVVKDPSGNIVCSLANNEVARNYLSTEGELISYDGYFVTGDEGNYTVTINNSGNSVLTGLYLYRVEGNVLTFTDGQAVPNYAPGTYPNVKIDRKLTAGRWVTAVYPFAISGVEDLTIANATSVEEGVVKFTHVDASEANKPFFMISEEGKTSIELENVEVAAAASTDFEGDGVTTVGSYAMKTILDVEEGKTKYVLQSNKLNYVGANETWVNTYRAYLVVPTSATDEVKQLSIAFDGDESTGINGVTVEKQFDGTIYDLSGRVVKNPSRGLYIINGKKVMVK